MKKFIRRVLRLLGSMLLISFILFTGILALLLYLRTRDLNNINSLYAQVQENLNKNIEESELTINNLQQSFSDLNLEVDRLKTENKNLSAEIEKYKRTGFGEIVGEVVPLIVGGSTFSQYQLVCAENVADRNLLYCVTVPAVAKRYSLLLPAGTYNVSSRLISTTNTITEKKTYYSEYVKCVQESQPVGGCNIELASKNVDIVVESGKKISGIDPIGWIE